MLPDGTHVCHEGILYADVDADFHTASLRICSLIFNLYFSLDYSVPSEPLVIYREDDDRQLQPDRVTAALSHL